MSLASTKRVAGFVGLSRGVGSPSTTETENVSQSANTGFISRNRDYLRVQVEMRLTLSTLAYFRFFKAVTAFDTAVEAVAVLT